jgi:hypothetical protein
VRVAAWHRGERPTASWQPLSAWEPVIYVPARPLDPSSGGPTRRVDSLVHGVSPMTTLPGRVIGTKPAAVCRWIFDLLGAQPHDTLDDLYPGSGAVTRAWAVFTGHTDPAPDPSDPPANTTPPDPSWLATPDASDRARADASRPPADTTPPAGRTAPARK